MHFIGSGHIPLEHTETLQESPDLILALLDFAPEILGLARLVDKYARDFYMENVNF